MSVPETIRDELLRFCRGGKRTRSAIFSREAPVHWNVYEAIDDDGKTPLTEDGAWSRIEHELNNGCVLNKIILDKPPGKVGYWFKFTDGIGQSIYVKLQIGNGKVLGRSFHIDIPRSN